MQKLINLQSKSNNKIAAISAALTVFFISNPAYAVQLTNAKGALDKLQEDLTLLIPLAAGVILLCLAIGYAGRYISKDTFVRWAIGVVIAGSATQLANLLFKGTA
ncbi:VirB2 family type IV secretion system major pilin TrwL [Bartonella krasnovii]|uniref:VirB2 family type IV secretion system major pilin TrwL n=1 Tax=Bartonella krasnovii TaxID=2267275 RepID=UPI001F4D095F|nr:VirB2 family type IV secretion system major pilin TrwL [Bartonella krasnovii]UNF51920.1 VirB2 family type IV secretion system major pilin TrwL [Bartonella krasnovii]